ncbi:hypothetical protein [Chitinophaga caseinilytica]|uniref:DUF3990 domain-containing protein n=1 Tax=Chitinophaga caseinilytica TaxID=2267521 RepID=A0ABZ2Z882_9BACT
MGFRNVVFGYHGCDARLASQLLHVKQKIRISRGEFEWLGHGMYFWENNLERAREWAKEKSRQGLIDTPAVIGAVLDLKNCCDFSDKYYLDLYQTYCMQMQRRYQSKNMRMPVNFAPAGSIPKDRVCRKLDCAIIEWMHERMQYLNSRQAGIADTSELPPFDSVRGLFTEGHPVFEGSGIYRNTHIQICIRNPECILGYFLPREGEMDEIEGFEVEESPALIRWN